MSRSDGASQPSERDTLTLQREIAYRGVILSAHDAESDGVTANHVRNGEILYIVPESLGLSGLERLPAHRGNEDGVT
jgi:hypothetical protein